MPPHNANELNNMSGDTMAENWVEMGDTMHAGVFSSAKCGCKAHARGQRIDKAVFSVAKRRNCPLNFSVNTI